MRKNRFYLEYKFLLTPTQKYFFLKELKDLLVPDSYGKKGVYQLKTTFYDTNSLDSYYDKLEGEFFKFKLRYRRYSSGDKTLELKLKKGEKTKKLQISPCKVNLMEEPKVILGENLNHWFDFKIPEPKSLSSKLFHPMCEIFYQREAYFFEPLPSYRITFDSNVQASSLLGPNIKQELLPQQCVLEIKSPGPLSDFFIALLQNYSIVQVNISKYAMALEKAVLNTTLSPWIEEFLEF